MKLWDHQVSAIAFAKNKPGVLFDHGMGCGKTKLALTIILDEGFDRTLVVCPKAVGMAWVNQAQVHAPCIEIINLCGTNPLSGGKKSQMSVPTKTKAMALFLKKQQITGKPLIVAVNYEAVWREPFCSSIFSELKPDCIIADEIHKIKAPGSKVSKTFQKFSRMPSLKKRIGLSGTPMPQTKLDIYGAYRFLDSSIFGTNFSAFRYKYAIMGGFENRQVIGFQREKEFAERYSRIRHHASRDNLNLPDAVHRELLFELPPKVRAKYNELHKDMITSIGDEVISADIALVKMLRLQQITSGFISIENDDLEKIEKTIHDEKILQLKELIDDIEKDEPLVIFHRFKRDAHHIKKLLDASGQTYSTVPSNEDELSQWQQGGTDVLIVQVRAGSEGIDATRARHNVFFSVDFSLGQFDQALARSHRPGQNRTVFYHHIIAINTIDQYIYDSLRARKESLGELFDLMAKEGLHNE